MPPIIASPETILDHINEGVYITDLDRRIVYWSPGAERITGWRAEEVVGTCCHDGILEHIDKDGRQLCGNHFCPLHASILRGRRVHVPFLVYARRRMGDRVPVEVTTAPYRADDGRLLGGIEVFREKREEAFDLEMARTIQRSFLGDVLPRGRRVSFEAAFLPMEMVGGDFLRVEAVAPGLFAFMLGDVIGHGISGALYTMLLRSIWEECRDQLADPEAFVRNAGKRLAVILGEDTHFVSGLFGVIDEEAGELRYCDMGGPEFLHRRANGTVETHKSFGELLGLREWSDPKMHCIPLSTKESLLFFTDGLIELENADGRPLGLGGIRARFSSMSSLPPARFIEKMTREIHDHSVGALAHDDITLLMVTMD
jgi:PAS domain S-box-containing protein